MNISFHYSSSYDAKADAYIICAFQKDGKIQNSHWTKELKEVFANFPAHDLFTGAAGSTFEFCSTDGHAVLAVGLGDKKKVNYESLRKNIAKVCIASSKKYRKVAIQLDQFVVKSNIEASLEALTQGVLLGDYRFEKYISKKAAIKLTEVIFDTKEKKTKAKKFDQILKKTEQICDSINVARDFVNEPPNVLTSTAYAKRVVDDVKKNLKGVKTKVLGKAELKKEKMGMFLSVNAASAHDPRLVHLTYTPKKVTKNTKHIALVGKGLTFDTGGYSLKPAGSIINMKTDMAGSATVYGAFRAAVLTEANVKISCFLGMTDNAINEHATMPDAIVKARNGKTVEILNTDAEGRLVLGDVLDYACDFKPDAIIDSATLTGACLVSLGTEICGVMGNNKKLIDGLKKSAGNTDEYIWELPIIDEFREDMKSNIADLKNIGGSRFGGTAKAAAFLENFVRDDIAWAHLDIAGVSDGQSHLPYCPPKGASGIMIRTLVDYFHNA